MDETYVKVNGIWRYVYRAIDHHGRAFIQNPRRGHYELSVDAVPALRVAAAFTELARAI